MSSLRLLLNRSLALFCLLLAAGGVFASSHREAPLIANDPLADNVDVYAFRSPDNPGMITLIATYIPLQLPHGGPNYYTFGQHVRYEIHVDNDAAKPGDEVTYRFTFKQVNEDPTTFFNIRLGKQNLKTTYTLERSTDGGRTFSVIVQDGIVPPTNIGKRSIESGLGLGMPYEEIMANAISSASSGERVFCGTSDDPFFVDLGGVFDLGNLPRQDGPSMDGLACYNVSVIAIQVPIATLLKEGAPSTPRNILDADYVIGVWASASRPKMRTLGGGEETHEGDWVQVSRLGMPLTNEAVIPIGRKDFWNSITPYDEITETTLDPYFFNPELALYMDDTKFGGAVPAFAALRIQRNSLGAFGFGNGQDGLYALKGSAAVAGTALDDAVFGTLLLPGPGMPRSVDLWPIFHTGVPNVIPYQLATGKGGNPLAAGKPFINNFLPNGGDMLRLNMAVPPTPRNDPAFSSLGIIQAAVLGLTDPAYAGSADLQFIPNMDGFPNGRRLEDDVTRIELQAVAGAALAAVGLWYDDFTPGGSPLTQDLLDVLTYTTGVEGNDAAFKTDFPYVATPWAGDGGCGGNPYSTQLTDLSVSLQADRQTYGLYQNIVYTVTVSNKGVAKASNVQVAAGLPDGTAYTSATVSQGEYNLFFETWHVGTLEAGASATLKLSVFTLIRDVDIDQYVQIIMSDQKDIDSQAGNGTPGMVNEDDEAMLTVTYARPVVSPDAPALNEAAPVQMNAVFPSPATDQVTVQLESTADFRTQLQVYDMSGKLVINQPVQIVSGSNRFEVPVRTLPAGTYLLHVNGLQQTMEPQRFMVGRQ